MGDGRQYECPICLDPYVAAVTTSCGHTFCSPCLLELWNRGGKRNQVRCPMCRSNVSMLIPSLTTRSEVLNFQRSPGAPGSSSGVEMTRGQSTHDYDAQIEEYNQRFREYDRSLPQQLNEDWVLLLRIFQTPASSIEVGSGQHLLYKAMVAIAFVLMVIYLVVPFDLIPDFMGVVGYLDDLFMLLGGIWAVVLMVEYYRSNLLSRLTPPPTTTTGSSSPISSFSSS
ncbi:Postreplication repair E3 ubiquitin-protein ligase RAD18 [Balamuthia mandrillaris]